MGLMEEEVEALCEKHDVSIEEIKNYYGGYVFDGASAYNPYSISRAMLIKSCNNYWTEQESCDVLRGYLEIKQDGLKDSIVRLMSGESLKIEIGVLGNDGLMELKTVDNVLTFFVHLGYLTYSEKTQEVRIPNQEVLYEFKCCFDQI